MSTMTVEEALRVTEGFDGAAHLVDEYVAECVCVLRDELNRPHQRLLRLVVACVDGPRFNLLKGVSFWGMPGSPVPWHVRAVPTGDLLDVALNYWDGEFLFGEGDLDAVAQKVLDELEANE